MTPGQALKELVTLANRPNGVVWPQLQPHHRQQVQTAIRNRLIADGASGYTATADGRRFIGPPEPQEIPGKVCPACHEDKEADQFWADPNRSDGLFYYCISCESNRRKEVRRMKREHHQAINVAATLAQQAARNWDEATALLAKAWQEMVAADTTIRQARAAGATKCDWGQIDLRLMHQAGAYTLAYAMTHARYPWPGSFLHNDGMPTALSAWVGDDPAEPYLSAGNTKLEEDADGSSEGHDAPERGEGTGAGRSEQGDDSIPGDHPEAARVQLTERQPVAEAGRRGRPRKSA